MNYGRLRSFALVASLLATKAAYAQAPAEPSSNAPDASDAAPGGAAPVPESPPKPAPEARDAAPASASKPATESAPEAPAPSALPVTSRWHSSLYGFVELDAIHDSTQSFSDGSNSGVVARRGTYAGDRGQALGTIKNSRLGLKLGAPDYYGVRSSAQLELDFFGIQPTDATQNDFYVLGTMRVRQAFMKLETPIVDVLAGQYQDLFGWGGSGFYPNTVAFLGVPGEIYHRNPQLRLSKRIGGDVVSLEIAAAALRPVQRHSEVPDVQGGLKVSFDKWQGATSPGSQQTQLTAAALGVSALGRRFVLPQFIGQPRNSTSQTGWGVALDAVIPVIPASSLEDHGNAFTLTAEASTGTGIADMYTNMTAGARLPELANPANKMPPETYPQDVDPGLITFDADNRAKTYKWTGIVLGAQYYLPIAGGKIWVSGTYSQISSDNILLITPAASWGAVYKSARYYDVNVFAALTPAAQLGLSFQATHQTYGDRSTPTNLRSELAMSFFF